MKEICFVTGNKNKFKEVRKILNNHLLISLNDLKFNDEIPENKPTIQENAFLKANFIYDRYKINCFSDDTGLFINQLNGEPGVKSARYAGDKSNSNKNINLVLNNLSNYEERCAYFKTQLVEKNVALGTTMQVTSQQRKASLISALCSNTPTLHIGD